MWETRVQSLGWEDHLEKGIPTPVFLPGESHGWRSLVGYSPRGRKELDTTERLHFHFSLSYTEKCINQTHTVHWIFTKCLHPDYQHPDERPAFSQFPKYLPWAPPQRTLKETTILASQLEDACRLPTSMSKESDSASRSLSCSTPRVWFFRVVRSTCLLISHMAPRTETPLVLFTC